MPLVQLSDAVIPAVYKTYQVENSPEKTNLINSGIIVESELLNEKANSGGRTVEVPFWKDLDSTQEPNYSDDSEGKGVPNKLGSGIQTARVNYLNQGYKDADLVTELAGSDPMQRIASRFNRYWDKQFQYRLIASTQGIMADNIANNAGDMVHDIALEAGNSATAANLYSRSAFVEAVFTMGDSFDEIGAVAVHSMILKKMIDNDDIDFVRDSTDTFDIPTFMGKRVIIDDGMPVVAGATNGFKYTSALYGQGVFGYGKGSPSVPVEIERSAAEGLGGGTETLWERKTWMIHPFGFSFNSTTVTGESPSLANLRLAANWSRIIDRKNVPVALLVTNG